MFILAYYILYPKARMQIKIKNIKIRDQYIETNIKRLI